MATETEKFHELTVESREVGGRITPDSTTSTVRDSPCRRLDQSMRVITNYLLMQIVLNYYFT